MKAIKLVLAALVIVPALLVVGLAYFAVVMVLLVTAPWGYSSLNLFLFVSMIVLTAMVEAVKQAWKYL